MNIFATSRDPEKAALDLQDIHKKMILESAQLLSTAHVQLDGVRRGYGATHINHPSAIWVRDSPENYRWLVEYTLAATAEFKRRGGNEHKSGILVREKLKRPPRNYLDCNAGLTPVRLAIADYLKINGGTTWKEVIQAYKFYYCVDKLFFSSEKTGWFEWNGWTNASPPDWFIEFWEYRSFILVKTGSTYSMRPF